MSSLQTRDFWRVNSYGYPNYFSTETNAKEAWTTFSSFYEHDGASYTDLKGFWDSRQAPRRLDSHAVESWKATFEEFGLLHVISRSDLVTITPGGHQLHEAAEQNDEQAFAWIGLNLLFRYPLHGPPRRRRNAAHCQSDLLPYRFLYSAMRDLGDYFWWTELERVFCRVFATSEAPDAVAAVSEIRADISRLSAYPLVVANRKGAFYNSLNQVANHAGMNHLVLTHDNSSEHYGASESRRRHSITRRLLRLVSAALGDVATPAACRGSARYVDRLPAAPSFADEPAYFDYLGAEVPTLATVTAAASPQTLNLSGDNVFILKAGEHFQEASGTSAERKIDGLASTLCTIARNHRVILSTDHNWTFLVVGKTLVGPDTVQLLLRRARPITNVEPIQQLLGEDNDER